MKVVKSLCKESNRKYYQVENSPLQISVDKLDKLHKIHIAKKGSRIESNRVVFELDTLQLEDLKSILFQIL